MKIAHCHLICQKSTNKSDEIHATKWTKGDWEIQNFRKQYNKGVLLVWLNQHMVQGLRLRCHRRGGRVVPLLLPFDFFNENTSKFNAQKRSLNFRAIGCHSLLKVDGCISTRATHSNRGLAQSPWQLGALGAIAPVISETWVLPPTTLEEECYLEPTKFERNCWKHQQLKIPNEGPVVGAQSFQKCGYQHSCFGENLGTIG